MSANLTQKAIKNSFLKLLNERALDKITVKDIVEDCGVNRNTFYYHYQDIYDLLEDIFEEETQRVVETNKIGMQWQKGLIQATQFALSNKKAIYHIYHSVNREQLERYLLQIADGLVGRYLRSQVQGLNVSDEDFSFITAFYKHAVVGLLLEWLQNGMKTEPEHFIQKMTMLFEGSSRHLLEAAAQSK